MATTALKDATKVNEFIYHQKIPDINSVSMINRISVIKTFSVPVKFLPEKNEFFQNLMPNEVQKAMVSYNSKKEEIVIKAIKKISEGNTMMNDFINDMNLEREGENRIDDSFQASIKEKCANIIEAGGLEEVIKSNNKLIELQRLNNELLYEIENMLNQEEGRDSTLKTQYGTR